MSAVRASVAAAVVAAALLFPAGPAPKAAEPPNFAVTTATCPVCRAVDDANWNFVTANQLSIRGNDPVGPYAGYWSAYRGGLWVPQSVRKQTLCGTLDHFNFFDGGGDEADWNNFTLPDPAFRFLIDDVVARYGTKPDWHRDTSGRLLMETEVTPDEHFYENPWFPKSSGVSPIEGNKLCAYGAWVADDVHGLRPEIHPAEQYWWRSGNSGYVLAVEDDSNRFDRVGDYFFIDTAPTWWRSWSAVPRTATFDIAFSLSTLRRRATITINEEAVRENVLSDSVDADDGATHAFEYNGRPLLDVVEQGFADNRLKVEFVRYCRNSNNRTVRGYVRLTTKVGSGDRGREGYHLLRITEEPQPGTVVHPAPVIAPAMLAPVLVATEVDPGSIHVVTVGRKPVLVADFRLTTEPTGRTRPGDLIVTGRTVTGADRIQPPFEKPARQVRVTVPVMQPAPVRLRTATGRVLAVAVPRVGPAPVIDAPRIVAATPAPRLWPVLARAAGGRAMTAPPGATVRVGRLLISGKAAYAVLRDGQVSREDESPLAEEVSEPLHDAGASRRVFGTAAPVRLTWSFAARNLATGAAVPVSIDAAPRPGGIVVRTRGSQAHTEAEAVSPEKGVFELTARLSMRDRFGHAGQAETTVSNLLVSSARTSDLVRAAARLAGASEATLTRLAAQRPLPTAGWVRDALLERAQAVRAVATDVAHDRLATLAELRRLVAAARLFGKTR